MKTKKLILGLIVILFTFPSCNYIKPEKGNISTHQRTKIKDSLSNENYGLDLSERYKAEVNEEMTLSEVAGKNEISLNYLKAQLGINQNLKHDYKLKQIRRNYKFTINDVKKIIIDYHNEKIYKQYNNTK